MTEQSLGPQKLVISPKTQINNRKSCLHCLATAVSCISFVRRELTTQHKLVLFKK